MNIYLLVQQYNYEGDEIIAAYAKWDKAQAITDQKNQEVQNESYNMELDKPYCRFKVITMDLIP